MLDYVSEAVAETVEFQSIRYLLILLQNTATDLGGLLGVR
jgi:hypothetical protein